MTPDLVLYSRSGCHLCEDMRRTLEPLLQPAAIPLRVVDIDADPALRERFGWRVPVLALDGDPVCEGRLDEDAVRDALKLR